MMRLLWVPRVLFLDICEGFSFSWDQLHDGRFYVLQVYGERLGLPHGTTMSFDYLSCVFFVPAILVFFFPLLP